MVVAAVPQVDTIQIKSTALSPTKHYLYQNTHQLHPVQSHCSDSWVAVVLGWGGVGVEQ